MTRVPLRLVLQFFCERNEALCRQCFSALSVVIEESLLLHYSLQISRLTPELGMRSIEVPSHRNQIYHTLARPTPNLHPTALLHAHNLAIDANASPACVLFVKLDS